MEKSSLQLGLKLIETSIRAAWDYTIRVIRKCKELPKQSTLFIEVLPLYGLTDKPWSLLWSLTYLVELFQLAKKDIFENTKKYASKLATGSFSKQNQSNINIHMIPITPVHKQSEFRWNYHMSKNKMYWLCGWTNAISLEITYVTLKFPKHVFWSSKDSIMDVSFQY